MALPRTRVASMVSTLDGYMAAFNDYDLDGVMRFFAVDAVYRPGNGVEREGLAAIRAEFEPQFKCAFGAMRSDECDRIIDENARKIVIRYICRHDLAHVKPMSLGWKLARPLLAAVVGNRFGWEGADVFHFDEAGRIKGKFTYAGYKWPRFEEALGSTMPSRARSSLDT